MKNLSLVALLVVLQACSCTPPLLTVGTPDKLNFLFKADDGPMTLTVDCLRSDEQWVTMWKVSGNAASTVATYAGGYAIEFLGTDKSVTYGQTPAGMETLVAASALPGGHYCSVELQCTHQSKQACVGRRYFLVGSGPLISCDKLAECQRDFIQTVI